MKLSAGSTLAIAIALASCNNAEQVKKQVDAQNASIQTLVDQKLNGLQEQVNTACAAKVDSLAAVAFATFKEEAAAAAKKGGKKPAVKPKPKPVVHKKEEPKGNTGKKADKPAENDGKKTTEPAQNLGKKH